MRERLHLPLTDAPLAPDESSLALKGPTMFAHDLLRLFEVEPFTTEEPTQPSFDHQTYCGPVQAGIRWEREGQLTVYGGYDGLVTGGAWRYENADRRWHLSGHYYGSKPPEPGQAMEPIPLHAEGTRAHDLSPAFCLGMSMVALRRKAEAGGCSPKPIYLCKNPREVEEFPPNDFVELGNVDANTRDFVVRLPDGRRLGVRLSGHRAGQAKFPIFLLPGTPAGDAHPCLHQQLCTRRATAFLRLVGQATMPRIAIQGALCSTTLRTP